MENQCDLIIVRLYALGNVFQSYFKSHGICYNFYFLLDGSKMPHGQCYRLKILNHGKFKDSQNFGSQLMCHPTNSMTGFLLSRMKVLISALESALEQRVPLLGISRLRDYFQSKDRGRISQKKVLKKCSIMLCAFFQYSKSENPFFDGKS